MGKFKDIDVVDALRVMQQHIDSDKMGLLVGSGSSRCACDLYSDWYGLIRDMVVFLYEDELIARGIQIKKCEDFYCHYKLSITDKESSDENTQNKAKAQKDEKALKDKNDENDENEKIIKDIIGHIIDREGLLQIPSQFVKRTGWRESVEAYIESHTPKLDPMNNTASLFDRMVPLDSRTDFLNTMLKVRWNAVFTTNYDDLLEFADGMNGTMKFKVGSRAADLSLRNMREMIVKLHGSIDFEQKMNGFDCDMHRKYIITQEDYEDYPVMHEAFMQLMRISLLKDCLCMVGFSGRDPNFIAWINWVREIIERNVALNHESGCPKAEDIKVFFIDALNKDQDSATQKFFENHRIYRISLWDSRVLQLIGIEEKLEMNSESISKLFKAFFSYLDRDNAEGVVPQEEYVDEKIREQRGEQQRLIAKSEEANTPAGVEDKNQTEQLIYQDMFSLWANAYKLTGKSGFEVLIDQHAADRLIRYQSYLRLSKGTYYQSYFIKAIARKPVISVLEAKMTLMALEQMQEDYDDSRQDLLDKVEESLSDETELERVKRLKNRHVTWVAPFSPVEGESDMAVYERCARFAFTFEFDELREELESWNPAEDFVFKKLVLLSLLDMEAVDRLLSQALLDKVYPSVERFRATQLANILSRSIPGMYSVDEFTDLSQHSIYSLRDWYFGDLIQPRERVYGYGSDSQENRQIEVDTAVRCLNFLLETPLMPQIGNWSLVSASQWYKVAHVLFEKYPYPVLFYSSTVNDEGMLKRIGQDYAYSAVLHEQLPEMALRMFRLITGEKRLVSYWTSHNICLLLCEIIMAVPSSYWDDFILRLWKKDYLPNFSETHRSDAIFKLISVGLSCTSNEDLAITVIQDCLKVVRENKKYAIVQDLFYYLKTKHSRKVSIAIRSVLNDFISQIDSYHDFILMGNLFQVISKSQYRAIAKRIPLLIPHLPIKTSSVNGLIYYAKSDKKILAMVKRAVLDSGLLWKNGIMKGGGASPVDFLPIVDLDSSLQWTTEEVHEVYTQLVSSAKLLMKKGLGNEWERIMNYEDLLYEMMEFIDLHRDQLGDVEELDGLYLVLEDKYKQLTDYVDLNSSIYSDVDSEMEVCLDALAAKVRKDGIYHHVAHLSILVTRLLCRNTHSYREVLDYMQYYVRTYLNSAEDLNLIPQLSLLMDKLTLDEFRSLNQNVILCAELSILMAEKLQNLGMRCKGIDYWMKLKKERYFNWRMDVNN